MITPSLLFFLLHVVLLFAGHSVAAPTSIPRSQDLGSRADGSLDKPVTVTVVHQTETSLGTVTETCEITLTPQVQPGGKQVVEEVKKCKVTMDAGTAQGGGDTKSSDTNSSSASPSSTAASANPPPSASSSQGAPSSTPASSSSSTPGATSSSSQPSSSASSSGSASSSSASASGNPALSVNGVSTVNSAATPTGSSTTSSSASSSPAPAPATTSATPTTSTSGSAANGSSSASSSGTGSAAAAEQTSSTAFAVPGKKLSVLPIGLGVFAGISVIALIVVGLVTYERTKYRKAFRQRKLAEAGANMGYGGMAERP